MSQARLSNISFAVNCAGLAVAKPSDWCRLRRGYAGEMIRVNAEAPVQVMNQFFFRLCWVYKKQIRRRIEKCTSISSLILEHHVL